MLYAAAALQNMLRTSCLQQMPCCWCFAAGEISCLSGGVRVEWTAACVLLILASGLACCYAMNRVACMSFFSCRDICRLALLHACTM